MIKGAIIMISDHKKIMAAVNKLTRTNANYEMKEQPSWNTTAR
jgi:hypothetical protein